MTQPNFSKATILNKVQWLSNLEKRKKLNTVESVKLSVQLFHIGVDKE